MLHTPLLFIGQCSVQIVQIIQVSLHCQPVLLFCILQQLYGPERVATLDEKTCKKLLHLSNSKKGCISKQQKGCTSEEQKRQHIKTAKKAAYQNSKKLLHIKTAKKAAYPNRRRVVTNESFTTGSNQGWTERRRNKKWQIVWLKTKSAQIYKSQPLATAAEASVVGGAEGKLQGTKPC